MIQFILDIFYYIGIFFAGLSSGIGLYLTWHFVLLGGRFKMRRNKEKDVEIKIILYNYTKHFKYESIR
jgi:hypothetical protein